MAIPIYQIDAFAERVFMGNPAAICPLESWLPDARMQAIAAENNLAETAFFVPEGDGYALRWFTPTVEVDLCGHATLAAAWLIFDRLRTDLETVRFSTRSGILEVTRDVELLSMDFPSRPATACATPEQISRGLGCAPEETLKAVNYMAVLKDEAAVRTLEPDMAAIADLFPSDLIVTAPGDEVDFVSRYFAPGHGIPEDPVTGSAHCTLIPYWSARLGRESLQARQISPRGGALSCTDNGARVAIAGRAALFLEGTIVE